MTSLRSVRVNCDQPRRASDGVGRDVFRARIVAPRLSCAPSPHRVAFSCGYRFHVLLEIATELTSSFGKGLTLLTVSGLGCRHTTRNVQLAVTICSGSNRAGQKLDL